VPLNAAFEAAGFSTAMFSSLDDVRGSLRRENPELVIITGGIMQGRSISSTAPSMTPPTNTPASIGSTNLLKTHPP
jgi:hypothetical protein